MKTRGLGIFVVLVTSVGVFATETVVVKKDGAEATVNVHGATITSWKVDGHEQLFVSGASKLDGSSHIMGGVPIVFPKFADWGKSRPFHGFARILPWTLIKAGEGQAEFQLRDSYTTRGWWNHTFCLKYVVRLEPKALISSLTISNPSADSGFDFEVLYHTFIRVPDVRNITITGLKGLKYNDKTRGFAEFNETRDPLVIDRFTDSVYQATPNQHAITGAAGGKTLLLEKTRLPDLVVWNPWSEVIQTFNDLQPNEWTDFICAEAGHVRGQVNLGAGQDYVVIQKLQVVPPTKLSLQDPAV